MVYDIAYEDFEEFFDRVAEPLNKVTQMVDNDILNEIEQSYANKRKTSLAFLEENYIWLHSGMSFLPLSPFSEIYNEILLKLESNGIIYLWRRQYYHVEVSNPSGIGPQVLTMDHLMIGFLACLIPAVLSILTFIGESI